MGISRYIENKRDDHKDFLIDPNTNETIRFSDIYKETEILKRTMENAGFRKGDHVAIAIENGITAALVIIGVLKAGGILIPINLGWKKSELDYTLENSEADFLMISESVIQSFGTEMTLGYKRKEKFRNAYINQLGKKTHDPCEEEKDGDRLALLMYTSGTTGKPKGVKLTENNLLTETENIRKGHGISSEDTAMQVLPFYHINGLVIGLLTPFLAGETLIVPPKFSVSHFWEWIDRYKVSWVSAVPTIISMLLARTVTSDYKNGSMKFLRSASAPLPEAVLEEFEKRFGIPIVESFGISEGASQITTNPVIGIRKAGSVGVGQGNEVKVTDTSGKELAPGEVGEVRVRGNNIFYGYFHKPKETAESLRDGWFLTGDLGYTDEDGYLYLKGRKKEMINRAGEKFSPREIDELLYEIPDVILAAAVGVPDPIYNQKVVAYVKLRDDSKLTSDEIIRSVALKISDFKVPEEVYFIDDFPKGPSGKIQRLKLLERYVGGDL